MLCCSRTLPSTPSPSLYPLVLITPLQLAAATNQLLSKVLRRNSLIVSSSPEMATCICTPTKLSTLLFFFARERGKFQVIADFDSRDLEAQSFNYAEVEKKTSTFRGRVCWRGTSSKQEAGLAWRVCRTIARVVIWCFCLHFKFV